MNHLISVYVKLMQSFESVGLFLFRAYFGIAIALAGLPKLAGEQDVIDEFAALSLPEPAISVVATGIVEVIGGALIVIGLGTRVASLPLVVTMVIAFTAVHMNNVTGWEDVFHIASPDAHAVAGPLPFLAAFLITLFVGPGKFSCDYFIGRSVHKKKTARKRL